MSTMRRQPPGRSALSQGHLPASSRPAVPTRVHQGGGSPNHHAQARRANQRARPPPRSPGSWPGSCGRRWRPNDAWCSTVTAEIGATVTTSRKPRRGAVAAGPIPVSTMRRPPSGRRVLSQGHLPASSRPAVPTRVHQCGGSPIHHAPARLADRRARPPPRRALLHHAQPVLPYAGAARRRHLTHAEITPSTRQTAPLTRRSTSVLRSLNSVGEDAASVAW